MELKIEVKEGNKTTTTTYDFTPTEEAITQYAKTLVDNFEKLFKKFEPKITKTTTETNKE